MLYLVEPLCGLSFGVGLGHLDLASGSLFFILWFEFGIMLVLFRVLRYKGQV